MNKAKKHKVVPSISADNIQQPLKLSSPNFSSKVLGGLLGLQQEGLLCDYTLSAGDKHIKVHRAVMAACSDYFHVMMTGGMRESKEDSVNLQGVSSNGLEAVVHFAYSGNMQLCIDNIESVLAAAVHLQMQEAVDLCCQFLQTAISIDNCIDILNLIELYSLSGNNVRLYILENFEAISDCEQFFKFTELQMETFLQSNSLKIVSEYRLFELVLKWVSYDKDSREQFMPMLMQHVRLPLLSGEELVEKVSRVDVMLQNKACFNLLNEAKDYHIVTSKRPMLQTSRTQVRSHYKSLVLCHAENIEAFNLDNRRHAFLKDIIAPVYNPGVCVVDNFMYVCGGKYDGTENNEIATARCFRYDPQFDTWFEASSMNEPRKDFVLLTFNKQLFAFGGQDENTVMSSVECFSITNNEWDIKAPLDCTNCCAAGAVCGNYIYFSGGIVYNGYSQKLLRYDPLADTWEDKMQMIQARANHVLEPVGIHLYSIGGSVHDSFGFPVPVTSIEQYNTEVDQWTLCRSTINVREAASCVLDGTIYIVGGINGDHYFSDLIISFNPDKDCYEIMERFPTRIHGKACCILILPQFV